MNANTDQDARLLSELRQRRAELRASMGTLERALASPYRADAAASWAARLAVAVRGLYDDFGEHITITEGPEGLYNELAERSPRLTRAIERLTAEHSEIMRTLEELLTSVDVTDQVPDVPLVRTTGTDLLAALMRHRQRGADLVYEAYDFELGGET